MISKIEKDFVDNYLKTGYKTKSLRQALERAGKGSEYSDEYLRLKAHRLIMKDNIQQEIANRKQIMETNATLASQRFQQIIREGKDSDAIKAGIFAIEQVDGKATQTIETNTTAIRLNVDLTGAGKALEAPDSSHSLEG